MDESQISAGKRSALIGMVLLVAGSFETWESMKPAKERIIHFMPHAITNFVLLFAPVCAVLGLVMVIKGLILRQGKPSGEGTFYKVMAGSGVLMLAAMAFIWGFAYIEHGNDRGASELFGPLVLVLIYFLFMPGLLALLLGIVGLNKIKSRRDHS
ncbi:MAG: hypothetical protein HQM09_21200 [Candidatus Riflebacteria bacterium]|nr:hypothetical protein [Candidatus Riflebacteria bacterium]